MNMVKKHIFASILFLISMGTAFACDRSIIEITFLDEAGNVERLHEFPLGCDMPWSHENSDVEYFEDTKLIPGGDVKSNDETKSTAQRHGAKVGDALVVVKMSEDNYKLTYEREVVVSWQKYDIDGLVGHLPTTNRSVARRSFNLERNKSYLIEEKEFVINVRRL